MNHNRRTSVRIVVLVLVACLLASCSDKDNSTAQALPPPQVSVAKPLIESITEWDEYTGRLGAVENVDIRSRVSGYLDAIRFRDGAIVQKGDLLFVIDPRPYQAVLDQTQAELSRARIKLELAKNDLDRAERLYKSRAISEEELDSRAKEEKEANAALESAQAAVKAAALDVEFTNIKAPITGRIGRSLVDVGNLVSGGSDESTLLANIVSLDPIHVTFTADERAFLKYVRLDREGTRPSSRDTPNPVYLQLADEDGFPHAGHMDFVDNQIDQATGTMLARAIFDNPDYVLTPGLFAKVRLLGRGPYEAVLIPDDAILSDQSIKFVYVLGDENIAQRRSVSLGSLHDGLRIITQGLQTDDLVVISGIQRVRADTPVTPKVVEITQPKLAASKS